MTMFAPFSRYFAFWFLLMFVVILLTREVRAELHAGFIATDAVAQTR